MTHKHEQSRLSQVTATRDPRSASHNHVIHDPRMSRYSHLQCTSPDKKPTLVTMSAYLITIDDNESFHRNLNVSSTYRLIYLCVDESYCGLYCNLTAYISKFTCTCTYIQWGNHKSQLMYPLETDLSSVAITSPVNVSTWNRRKATTN